MLDIKFKFFVNLNSDLLYYKSIIYSSIKPNSVDNIINFDYIKEKYWNRKNMY